VCACDLRHWVVVFRLLYTITQIITIPETTQSQQVRLAGT
jgi:hypothetical protein